MVVVFQKPTRHHDMNMIWIEESGSTGERGFECRMSFGHSYWRPMESLAWPRSRLKEETKQEWSDVNDVNVKVILSFASHIWKPTSILIQVLRAQSGCPWRCLLHLAEMRSATWPHCLVPINFHQERHAESEKIILPRHAAAVFHLIMFYHHLPSTDSTSCSSQSVRLQL